MRRQILMASAALALVSASPALAQQVSPAEAEGIKQRLTRYLPQEMIDAGLVTVKAATSFYELRFDPAVLLDKARSGAVAIEGLKPVTAYLRPLPEGTYRIEANENLDIKGSVTLGEEKNAFSYVIDRMKLDGVYDPETQRMAAEMVDAQVNLYDLIIVYFEGTLAGQIGNDGRFTGTWEGESTGTNQQFITGTASGEGVWGAGPQ